MPDIICIANQKGGVAKTTTAINLSDALGRLEHPTLVIDADPQGNTTKTLIKDMGQREHYSLVKALEAPIAEGSFTPMACPTSNIDVDIVPNTLDCMVWEKRVQSTPDSVLGFQRLIQNDSDINKYDFIIIDTPPNIGIMVNNSLMISDYVIVPIPVTDQYAIDGFQTFIDLMGTIKGQNTKIKLLGVLLTRYDARAPIYKKNLTKIQSFFKTKSINVFDTIIRVNVDLDKAHMKRKTIYEFDKNKYGAIDYENLAKEIISNV